LPTEAKKQSSTPWIIAVAVGLVLTIGLWSSYRPKDPNAVPTISSPQDFQLVHDEAERLSMQHLKDVDDGVPLTEKAKTDMQHAAALFDGMINAAPTNLALYIGCGKIYQTLGNDEAAIKRLQAGLSKVSIAPNPAIRDTAIEGHYLLSLSYFNLKNYPAALKEVSIAIDLFPTSPIYYTHRASIYIQLKNYTEATRDLFSALDADQSYKPALARLKLIGLNATRVALDTAEQKLNKKDFKGAATACTQGLRINPTDPDLLGVRAAAYIGIGEKEKAREDVQTIETYYPGYKNLPALEKNLR
jgi:tetratricopeptide (TPR) repeat protein